MSPARDDGFALPPGVDWVPADVALARLAASVAPVAAVETVPLADAGGRILAAAVRARRANPPAANAAVDGYGFAHASLGAAAAPPAARVGPRRRRRAASRPPCRPATRCAS